MELPLKQQEERLTQLQGEFQQRSDKRATGKEIPKHSALLEATEVDTFLFIFEAHMKKFWVAWEQPGALSDGLTPTSLCHFRGRDMPGFWNSQDKNPEVFRYRFRHLLPMLPGSEERRKRILGQRQQKMRILQGK